MQQENHYTSQNLSSRDLELFSSQFPKARVNATFSHCQIPSAERSLMEKAGVRSLSTKARSPSPSVGSPLSRMRKKCRRPNLSSHLPLSLLRFLRYPKSVLPHIWHRQ